MPKVSIITLSRNGQKYIKETIESVLNQSFRDFEYIIIDNGSFDSTNKIIDSYVQQDRRIIHIKNHNNKGIVGGRNQGLKQSTGQYICFLDQDDIWSHKDKLLQQIKFLETNDDIGILGSNCYYIDENNMQIGQMNYYKKDKDIRSHILKYNEFCTCSVMFRKNIIDQLGHLNNKYEKVDDYELWLRSGMITKFHNLQEYLVSYRIHSSNTSKNNKTFLHMKKLHFKLVKKYYKKYPNGYQSLLFSWINQFIGYHTAQILRRYYVKIFG